MRPAEGRVQTLDLTAFTPRSARPASPWRHAIRLLDSRGRLPIPEVSLLPGAVTAALRRNCWELRPATRTGGRPIVLDPRNRVLIPLGIRHQLGLTGAVLVSVALDHSRLLVWPAAQLDALLENR